MKYSLRSLMIVVAIAPPLLAAFISARRSYLEYRADFHLREANSWWAAHAEAGGKPAEMFKYHQDLADSYERASERWWVTDSQKSSP